ncbi:MAG TPA: CHRD domain-containing protein [Gemmatimonadaceae bacterium]
MKGRILLFASIITASAGCGGGSTIGGLDAEAVYTISLAQANQVPAPKATTATGTATVVVYADRVDYEVSANSIIEVTAAHIHTGQPGVAGPIVVTLFNQPNNPISKNGVFASGTLRDSNLPSGVTIDNLKSFIASGNGYIDIHTKANPNGELRGQIR